MILKRPTGNRGFPVGVIRLPRLVAAAASGCVLAWLALAVSPAAAALTVRRAPGTVSLGGLACSTARSCVAVGAAPTSEVYETVPVVVHLVAGRPGAAQRVTNVTSGLRTVFALSGVDCPSKTTCLAVGGELGAGFGTIVPIRHGRAGAPLLGDWQLQAIACPTAAKCLAAGYYSLDSPPVSAVLPLVNGRPGKAQERSELASLDGVACSSPMACVTVGQRDITETSNSTQGIVELLKRGRLREPIAVAGTGSLAGVACWNSSRCLAVGVGGTHRSIGVIVPIRDGKIGKVTSVPGTSELSAISCPSSSSCTVVGALAIKGGSRALVMRIDNGRARRPIAVPNTTQLSAIDCHTERSCLAAGSVRVHGADEGIIVAIGSKAAQK